MKYPEHGNVKTRLAADTNDSFAVKFYNTIATNIFNKISNLQPAVDIYLFYSGIDSKSDIKKWVDKDFYYLVQKGENLGEKMNNAFSYIFNEGYSKAVILGTDIPEINSKFIENAFSYLSEYKIVISPSNDGGYSLLGLQQSFSFLFENIEWSTSSVFFNTILKIKQNNISYKKLNTLNDIDTKEELILWMNLTNNENLKLQVKKIAKEEGLVL